MPERGTIYIKKDLGIGFIPIPKNGSTTIRKYVFNFNIKDSLEIMDKLSHEEISKTKKIVIISDPITRFSRGIIEVINRGENTEKIKTKEFKECKSYGCKIFSIIKGIEKWGFYDVHLKPQSYFILDKNGNPYPIDEFWYLENLTSKLKEIIPNYDGELTWTRGSEKNPFLKAIMESLDLQKKIRELYREAFEIFDNPNTIKKY